MPYAANARTHSEHQVGQIAGSIREFGFNVPCLVDDKDELITGHGRLLAAKRLGLAEVPVIRLGHLTPDQVRAFRLADNRIALNSDWDLDLLVRELDEIAKNTDLALLGFDNDDLALHLKNGWDSDLAHVAAFGETLDGVEGRIVVRCRQADKAAVRACVTKAVEAAGIEGVSVE